MIYYCEKCKEYSLKRECLKCKNDNIVKKPAKFKQCNDYSKERLKTKGLI